MGSFWEVAVVEVAATSAEEDPATNQKLGDFREEARTSFLPDVSSRDLTFSRVKIYKFKAISPPRCRHTMVHYLKSQFFLSRG